MITCYFKDKKKAFLRHVTLSVIVLNKERNSLLLIRRADWLVEAKKLALPGGYLDRDETLYQAAQREVLEETGYEIEILSLFRIIDNPNRPNEDAQNIDFTLIAQSNNKIQNHDHEVSEVRWVSFNKLPPKEEVAFDHFDTIQLFIEYFKYKFKLPII